MGRVRTEYREIFNLIFMEYFYQINMGGFYNINYDM